MHGIGGEITAITEIMFGHTLRSDTRVAYDNFELITIFLLALPINHEGNTNKYKLTNLQLNQSNSN